MHEVGSGLERSRHSRNEESRIKAGSWRPAAADQNPLKSRQRMASNDGVGGRSVLRYRILNCLGRGGMGVVYQATDLILNRLVAMKFARPEAWSNTAAKQTILAEARAASALNHPNICTIHAVEEVPASALGFVYGADRSCDAELETVAAADVDSAAPLTADQDISVPFIVMEYIAGTLLHSKVAGGALPAVDCIDVGLQISSGLGAAHARGIIHRDIKPNNIMVTPSGLVKIMDFGVARIQDLDRQAAADVAGTPAYMSPEQIFGVGVDHRSDLFSTGVLLYEIATGSAPFRADTTAGLLAAITHGHPLSPCEILPSVPRRLDAIVMRCLEKDAGRRYQSAAELYADLEAVKRELVQAAEAARTAVSRHEAERRRATIMFGEIRPAAANGNAILDDALEVMREVIHGIELHGGTVDQVMGYSFTALFGLPVATERAASNALSCALAIRNAVAGFAKASMRPERLAIRIGICSGTVIAGTLGAGSQRRYSVFGDAVTTASALKDAAPPGHIYVAATTEAETRDAFRFASVRDATAQPNDVFDLITAGTGGSAAARQLPRTQDCVGRETELSRLRAHLLRLRNGHGAIVNLIGDPGVGKSRLVAEMLLDETATPFTVLRGRASATGLNLGYHVVVDLLKGWAGIRDNDGKTDAVQKLETLIAAITRDTSGEMFRFMATMLGLFDAQPRRQSPTSTGEGDVLAKLMLKHFRDLLVQAARVQPLVVVFEDLHWADQSSLELIESVLRVAETGAVLFINTFRPGYDRTSGRLVETSRQRYGAFSSDLTLEVLDRTAARRLLDLLLHAGAIDDQNRELIVDRSGGNPYFIEQIVELIANGGSRSAIPDTVQELLVARVDLLADTERTVLKTAAVIGRSFPLRTLAAVVGPMPIVTQALHHLERSRLLLTREQGGDVECYFPHALAQEAVYATIPENACRDLHLKVGNAIETLFADRLNERYGMLALHFTRGGDLAKAEGYLTRAGEEALKSAASSEAVYYYQQALDIYLAQSATLADPDRKAHLESNIGLALYNKGHMAQAVEHFDRALKYWGVAVPRSPIGQHLRLLADLTSLLIRLYVRRRQPRRRPTVTDNAVIDLRFKKGTALVSHDARAYFAESIAVLRQINRFDIRTVHNGAGIFASVSALFSVPAISFTLSERILRYTKPFIEPGDSKTLLQFRVSEVLLYMHLGRWREVPPFDMTLVDTCLQSGEQWFVWVYIMAHMTMLTEQGRYESAEALLVRLGSVAEMYESDLVRSRKRVLEARLRLKQRRLDAGIQAVQDGVAPLEAFGNPPLLIYLYALKANLEAFQGHTEAARRSLAAAETLISRLGTVPPYYLGTFVATRLRLDLEDLESSHRAGSSDQRSNAATRLRKSIAHAVRVASKNANDRPEIYRLVGVAAWVSNQQNDAIRWWNKSEEEAERLGAVPERARTYLEVAERINTNPQFIQKWQGMSSLEMTARGQTMLNELVGN